MANRMNQVIKGKKFLVTGGTGSFGKYITKFLLDNGADTVTVFSRDEDKQYTMQFDFQEYKDRLLFVIGDVRDKESLIKATKGKDIVFHAAALKQIPSTEYNPLEAVRTNVLGAQNVVDACIYNNVEKVIAISTDKAVEPINTMGLSKALQERIFILGNKDRGGARTKFSLVRYGNVVNSRGSVIPLFIKQIKLGKPITVTHAEMTRFILTLSQAIELVLTALVHMKGGEIFVPKLKALRIMDLAEVLSEELDASNKEIKITGIRPGEKLHETLLSVMEFNRAVEGDTYYSVRSQIKLDEDGLQYLEAETTKKIDISSYTSDTGSFLSKKMIKRLLQVDGVL